MNKQIGSYYFRHVCRFAPEVDATGTIRIFLPQSNYVNRSKLGLHTYGNGPFCKFVIPKDLHVAGVYLLTVEEEVKYIGECISLSKRYNAGYGQISPRNCYTGGQSTNCRINNLIYHTIQAGKQVNLWFMATQDHKTLESKLLALQNPRPVWNR